MTGMPRGTRPSHGLSAIELAANDFVRFMRLVAVSDRMADCWEWRGNIPDGRYGHFATGSRSVKAHRWMYERVCGPIPPGLMVRHRCDNPKCVNPIHLQVGTASDNMQDRRVRGRAPNRRGTRHPLAKLNDESVREIRRLSALGVTQAELSEKYGIATGQIYKIVKRINWGHVQ